VASSAHFLTLTYSEEELPWTDAGPTLVKSDYQKFMKRLRKASGNARLRYYMAGEYGTELGRPHYHLLLFNLPKAIKEKALATIWGKGFIYPGQVEPASIHYVTGYIINKNAYDYAGREPPFARMSRNPGIGKNYLTPQMEKWHVNGLRNFTQINGRMGVLPRYYRDKMFSKEQKAEMSDEAAWRGIETYRAEIARIAKIHSDPELYYEETIRYAHDKIKTSKNKN